MRPLTEAEKRDNAELSRLSKKVLRRDAVRTGQQLKETGKQVGQAGWKGTKQVRNIVKRRIARSMKKKK